MRVIPTGERKCVWMEAGVVSYKLCTNNYQCNLCEFDRAMANRAQQDKCKSMEVKPTVTEKKEIVEWMDEFRNLPADQRKCRYMLSGEVSYKICPNSFRCGDCSFDQMMQDRAQPVMSYDVEAPTKVSGFHMPENLFYFRNHTWLHFDRDGSFRIGLDDFARRLLGKVKSVELPAVGKAVDLEEYCLIIHHEFGDLEIFAPVEGVVTSTNHDLFEDAQLMVEQSYSDGWLMTIDPKSIRKTNKNLLRDDDAKSWMQAEAQLLTQSVQPEAGVTLHDGASLTDDMSENLSKEDWLELVKKHLYTR